ARAMSPGLPAARIGAMGALLAGAALSALAALGPRYGGDLTLGVTRLPQSTSPLAPAHAAERLVGGPVDETRLHFAREGVLAPGLAESWAAGGSGREWPLTLNPSARFHDATPVTAADAVRSLRRFLAGRSAAARLLADGLERDGLAAPDPRHLVLRFG